MIKVICSGKLKEKYLRFRVDHELWLTPEAKFKAISKLKRRGYRPQPLKRVYARFAQNRNPAACHIFAAVVAHTLYDYRCARVSYAEALACNACNECLA